MKGGDFFLYNFFKRLQSALEFNLVPSQYTDFIKAFKFLFQQSWIELYQILNNESIKYTEDNTKLDSPIIHDILQLCETLWLMHSSSQKKKLFQNIFREEIEKELNLNGPLLEEHIHQENFKGYDKILEPEKRQNKQSESKEVKKDQTSNFLLGLSIKDENVARKPDEKKIAQEINPMFTFPSFKLPLTFREVQHFFQYNRKGSSWVKSADLDIPATVNEEAKNLVVANPIYQKKKKSKAHILLLIDQLGSMSILELFSQAILSNFHSAISGKDTLEVYYFHNYVEEEVFKSPDLINTVNISNLFNLNRAKKFELIFIVSDAGGLNPELDNARVDNMQKLQQRFLNYNNKCNILWLNPLPSKRLNESLSAIRLAKTFRMVSADRLAWKKIPALIKDSEENITITTSSDIVSEQSLTSIPGNFSNNFQDNLLLRLQVDTFFESLSLKNNSSNWFWIAAHCAFFPKLTPDLIYQLCLNFKNIEVGYKHAHEKLSVVSDILQSTLVRETSTGYYEINITIRNFLINELRSHPKFGQKRILLLASFLNDYYERKLKFSSNILPSLKAAIELTILRETEPSEYDERITQLIDQAMISGDHSGVEKIKSFTTGIDVNDSPFKSTKGSFFNFIDSRKNGKIAEAYSNLDSILDKVSPDDNAPKVQLPEEYYLLINRKGKIDQHLLNLDYPIEEVLALCNLISSSRFAKLPNIIAYLESVKWKVSIVDPSIQNMDYTRVINDLNKIIKDESELKTPHTLIFLELLYLYAHTQNDKVFGTIKTMVDHFPIKVDLEELNKTEIEKAIKSINTQYYEKLRMRYFPKMISVPQNSRDPKGVRTKQFSIAETPITWWQFNVFALATNQELILPKDWILEGNHPAVKIDWKDALAYVDWLNKNELPPYLYEIPTEAEWMLSARSGGEEHFRYAGSNNLDEVGWYIDNSKEGYLKKQTHPVKLKLPNRLGIYDMSGNVWEWCQDIAYGNRKRVVKGGAWTSLRDECSIEHKNNQDVYSLHFALGFRVIRKLG